MHTVNDLSILTESEFLALVDAAKGHDKSRLRGARGMYQELTKRGDTALSEYTKSKTKMEIRCGKNPDHVFMVTPNSYKHGRGCPKCSGKCPEQARDDMYKELANRGDTALSEYTTNKTKMKIQCGKNPDHVFMVHPNSYKSGSGCPKCTGNCPEQARDDMYKELANRGDTALSEYTTATKKLKIRCGKNPDHIFEMIPNSYKHGQGCPKCAGLCPEQARDDMYKELANRGDTALSEYTTTRKKMKIRCGKNPDHIFEMPPAMYKSGQGCPKCAGCCPEQARDGMYNELAKRGDTALSEYTKNNTKMKIQCGKNPCHIFMIAPADYKHGYGCPKCAGLCPEQARDDMYKELANRGDTALSEYTTATKKLKIRCGKNPDHIFEMRPNNYKHGQGCPKCATSGYQPTNKGYLYIMRAVESDIIKIGISNQPNRRLKELTNATPFDFNRIELLGWQDGEIAQALEKQLHSLGTNAGLTGFDGATEWYNYDHNLLSMARNHNKSLQCNEIEE